MSLTGLLMERDSVFEVAQKYGIQLYQKRYDQAYHNYMTVNWQDYKTQFHLTYDAMEYAIKQTKIYLKEVCEEHAIEVD